MQAHHPYRHLLAHFETFGIILKHFEQLWATVSNFEQFWILLSNFEPSCRVSLRHFEQFWAFLSGKFGSCRAILHHVWKHDMALSALDGVQNVSIEAALRHHALAEKGSWSNPTDLDPKTRSVTSVPLSFHYGMVRTEIFQKGVGSPPHLDIFQLKKMFIMVSPGPGWMHAWSFLERWHTGSKGNTWQYMVVYGSMCVYIYISETYKKQVRMHIE